MPVCPRILFIPGSARILHALSRMKSIWLETFSMPRFSTLSGDVEADVCVIGGGIAGLTTAYLLAKEGKRVCLLEAFSLASGQTGRTTSHFSWALDDRYFELEKLHGEQGAKLAAESHRAAIDKVREIQNQELIDCEFQIVDGYLFAKDDPRQDVLARELAAIQKIGLGNDVHAVDKSPFDFFDIGPSLKFSYQVQLHPLKYLNGLVKSIIARGGQIYTDTHVSEITGGESARVKTSFGFQVDCDSIVVATNTPINDIVAIHTKQAPYRTYVLGFEVPRGSIPRGLYWDTLDPYHYLRLENATGDKEIFIVGGEDHKTGQEDHPEDRFHRLDRWTRSRFPMVKEVRYQWSGQVMEPVDGLAYLGHNPGHEKNVYIITGDSGNGVTHSTIGAMLITDQIMGRENPWEKLYDPSRIKLKASPEFLKENANVVYQYRDWFTAKPDAELIDLQQGEGVVFRDGLKLIAACKLQDGSVNFLSACCTHLGGVVAWNSVEKTWDCPCHGSRFDCYGHVVEGPAIKDLKKLGTRPSRRAKFDL